MEIPEGTRHHTVSLDELRVEGPVQAFELWTQTDLGVIDDGLSIDVPARDSRVIILRPVRDRPYLVASNRHVSQGATDLHDPTWDGATLAWAQDLVAGFAHTVYIDPAGRTSPPGVQASGGATALVREFGTLIAIDIEPAQSGSEQITLLF